MDNSAYMARQTGFVDPEDNEEDDDLPAPDALPVAIRRAGGEQVPWAGPEKLWPPDEQRVAIRLHPGQWAYALAELRNSEAVYEQLKDSETARMVRDAADSIEGQLPGL